MHRPFAAHRLPASPAPSARKPASAAGEKRSHKPAPKKKPAR